jgi:hypothetical protein
MAGARSAQGSPCEGLNVRFDAKGQLNGARGAPPNSPAPRTSSWPRPLGPLSSARRASLRDFVQELAEIEPEKPLQVRVERGHHQALAHLGHLVDDAIGERCHFRVVAASRFRVGVAERVAEREARGERPDAPSDRVLRKLLAPVEDVTHRPLHRLVLIADAVLDLLDGVRNGRPCLVHAPLELCFGRRAPALSRGARHALPYS